MAETLSEKVIKDTLHRLLADDEILHFHKGISPRRAPEILDFYVIDLSGVMHVIEVKETSQTNIARDKFNDDQKRVLYYPLVQPDPKSERVQSHLILRYFGGAKTRNALSYYEYYFLLPGQYADRKTVQLQECVADEDVVRLAEWKMRRWVHGLGEEYGLTNRGNPTDGLTELGHIFRKPKSKVALYGDANN